MFKQLYALARQLLTLMQDVQKLKAEQKEFRQELRALIDIVRQLKYEQQRDRENAAHEQEKLLLRLENALLRFERRLPPPGSTASGSADSVLPE
jgi:chromosome segregation ATPase